MCVQTDKGMAKKSSKKSGAKRAKRAAGSRHRKPRRSWSVYIYRALKHVHKDMGMSSKAMKIMNSFCGDVFERIATEAAHLVRISKTRTLGSRYVRVVCVDVWR